MKTQVVDCGYVGYSVHRNNIEEMDLVLRRGKAGHTRRVLWVTPNRRKNLVKGDLIILLHQQIQMSEGDHESFVDLITPVAVYSASSIHRSWSRGRRYSHAGTYFMTSKEEVSDVI